MPHNILNAAGQTQSNHLAPIPDLTFLISTLQEVTKTLLQYDQPCKVNESMPTMQTVQARQTTQTGHEHQTKRGESVHEQAEQSLNTHTIVPPSPPLSKRAQRKERYKECCYDPHDTTAFVDKDIAQSFENAYNGGNFRDEIRYYHVPASIVRHEYRLLCRHQQKDIMSLLYDVYNELDLMTKLLTYMNKDKDIAELPLMQLSISVSQSLKLFHTIHSYLDNFTLVHKTMLPRRNKQ